MLRITGILCGSAFAVAILILALGVPKFTSDDKPEDISPGSELAAPDVETVVVEIPDTSDVPATADATPTDVAVAFDAAQAVVAAEVNVAPPEVPVEANIAEDQALVDAIFAPVEERTEIATALTPDSGESWYAFWSPFRSELAAEGFIEQLQRTTGLDYRVVKQKIGVYEVAFAYSDQSDVENKLATIAAATGLEMPDG